VAVKNSPEIEGLAFIVHRSSAIGWVGVVGGAALALGGHILGVEHNDARGNIFESTFHRAAIGVAIVAIAFGAVAVGIDSLAAVVHARDAKT
jgi:hypothetical protein